MSRLTGRVYSIPQGARRRVLADRAAGGLHALRLTEVTPNRKHHMPKAKLVSITKDQRELLAAIQADPGMKVPKRSVALASLVRKGFVTSRHGGYGEPERSGIRSVSAPALDMCEITEAGEARLNPRAASRPSSPPPPGGGAKAVGSAELNRLITACAKTLGARQRISFAQSERHGADSDQAEDAGARVDESEQELFDLIGLVKTAPRRAALIKKYGLGWKVGK